jgi:hypothetical protein
LEGELDRPALRCVIIVDHPEERAGFRGEENGAIVAWLRFVVGR